MICKTTIKRYSLYIKKCFYISKWKKDINNYEIPSGYYCPTDCSKCNACWNKKIKNIIFIKH